MQLNTTDALALVYEQSYAMLVGYAERELEQRELDTQLAEDVVQDVTVGFLRANPHLRSAEQIRAYLCRSISNRCTKLIADPWAHRDHEFIDFETTDQPYEESA